jgi:DEAD/DEAH box helicase domain-containing protein
MAMQKLRFADLYRNNKAAVERTLASMWCGETINESQKAYVKQLRKIIGQIFCPDGAVPLVQCMNSYKNVFTVSNEKAEAVVGDLWRKCLPEGKYWPPYEHQYQSWNTLLNKKTDDGLYKSIVVTTGTGSGKTECFMMPLVRDLLDENKKEQVQAIFIYPLNALMEDQKERLEKLVAGTDLTYSVYNSDLPEKLDVTRNDYDKTLRKVDSIRGVERDDKGKEISVKYPHAIATREELRNHPANILLTNPTMLEYILLRGQDSNLVNPEYHSLRWIVMDETHTYTGAGAAEIAMLLRRVLLAYDVDVSEVRFATSSATIGNNKDDKTKDELISFIEKLTGLKRGQVEVIDGERKGIEKIPHDEDEKYWKRLINENKDGYIPLNELFDDGKPIIQELEHLDKMCQTAEANQLKDLRVKVHYFYRVPNHGLYVDITQHEDGSFKVYTENRPDAGKNGKAPLLEMSRCKHCGEYLAVAEVNYAEGTFLPITMDDSDMFDLDDNEETKKKHLIFGMSNEKTERGENNAPFIIHGDKFEQVTSSVDYSSDKWHVVGNTQCSCPYCGAKLTKNTKANDDKLEVVAIEEQDNKKLQKFRVAADFISRIIAPSTLELMKEEEPKDNKKKCLHRGQQYMSFVDSRQMAARSTIKQNLEEESLWVYSTIFHELSKRKTNGISKEKAIEEQTAAISHASGDEIMKRIQIINNLNSTDNHVVQKQLSQLEGVCHLTWSQLFDTFYIDNRTNIFCRQFAERSEQSIELDNKGEITEEVKKKYIQSILVQYLSKRPLSAAAPETMGLFTSYYPKLEEIMNNELPKAVEELNNMLSPENKIERKDWKNLIKIFLDYTVRSNQSVFLKMSDNDPMDIFKSVRFATQKERRRPVHKPQVNGDSANRSRVVRLLAALISKEKNITIIDAINGYSQQIENVIDAMWKDMTEKYRILNVSTHYNQELGQHEKDRDEIIDDVHYPQYRLNLADMSFKLYDDVCLCDTNVSDESESRHIKCLRPIDTLFKGFSPYIVGGEPQQVDNELHEEWIAYPYYYEEGGNKKSLNDIGLWAIQNRKLLWNNGLWGDEGLYADRLNTIYQYPDLFIQAEHTAQVDKMISRQVQKDFKEHALNILACSTTMEMGRQPR